MQLWILKAYFAGFLISFVVQTFFRERFGLNTRWGYNRGWQAEIGIWNLAALFITGALIIHRFESEIVMLGLFVMSWGFLINHALSARKGKPNLNHWLAILLNSIGILMIALWGLFDGLEISL